MSARRCGGCGEPLGPPPAPGGPEVARCARCGAPLCARCRTRDQGRTTCGPCARAAPPPRTRGGPLLPVLGALAALGLSAGTLLAVAARGDAVRAARDREALARLRFSLEDFFLDTSRYPDDAEGFAALLTPDPDLDGQVIPDWRGPYLDLARSGFRWSPTVGSLLDRHGRAVLYRAGIEGAWVYLASPGPNGQVDTPGLGGTDFDGTPRGDDVVVWVEGP